MNGSRGLPGTCSVSRSFKTPILHLAGFIFFSLIGFNELSGLDSRRCDLKYCKQFLHLDFSGSTSLLKDSCPSRDSRSGRSLDARDEGIPSIAESPKTNISCISRTILHAHSHHSKSILTFGTQNADQPLRLAMFEKAVGRTQLIGFCRREINSRRKILISFRTSLVEVSSVGIKN